MFRGKIFRLAIAVGICSVAVGSLTLVLLLGMASGVQPVSKLIIDTDAGVDDAIGILFALTDPTVQVQAITCVKGNTCVDNVVINVLKVLRVANKPDIPVYAGNDFGIMNNLNITDYFGKDGLGDVYFPNPPSVEEKQEGHPAVQLVKMVTENPGEITLICLGPLTNLAIAINLNPKFLSLVKRVIILGGTIKGMGNQSPGVEFNIYFDPDAASLVLQRAALFSEKVTILALEPVGEAQMSKSWRWDTLAKIKTKVVDFANQIEMAEQKLHPEVKYYQPYDACAVAIALIPEFVVTARDMFSEIDPYGQSARGVVLIDYYNLTSKEANVEFVMEINSSVFQDRLFRNFANYWNY